MDGSAALGGTATTDAGGGSADGTAGLQPATRRTTTKAACRRFAWPRQVIRPGAYPTAPRVHPREGHGRRWDRRPPSPRSVRRRSLDQPNAPTISRSSRRRSTRTPSRRAPSRTTRTEHVAWSSTFLATLPRASRRTPVCPRSDDDDPGVMLAGTGDDLVGCVALAHLGRGLVAGIAEPLGGRLAAGLACRELGRGRRLVGRQGVGVEHRRRRRMHSHLRTRSGP